MLIRIATLTLSQMFVAIWCSLAAAQIASAPYPKWFLDRAESSPSKLMFRMYGYEGMARNLFVLSCQNNKEIDLEIIPPKSLEERLRSTATARYQPVNISFSIDNSIVYRLKGQYDKIAAFAEIPKEKELLAFLSLFQNESFLIRWEQARIEYLLVRDTFFIKNFTDNFRSQLLQSRKEELSYQEVFIRCSKLWER